MKFYSLDDTIQDIFIQQIVEREREMFFYSIYCKKVQSDLYFPQLASIDGVTQGECDVTIEAGQISSELLHKAEEKKYEFGEECSWLVNSTCFLVIEKGKKITYCMMDGGNLSYLRTYILGWGLSMLALQLGEMAIHCSSVADKNGAVLICGESGSGKSTLTLAFLQNGWKFMTDDMALAEVQESKRIIIKPGFPYQKLCRDALSQQEISSDKVIYIDEKKDKYLVPCKAKFEENSMQARAIFILTISKTSSIRLINLQGMQKFYGVANNLFLRKLLGDTKYTSEIGGKCLELAAGVPIYVIERPDGVDTQEQVWDTVCSTLRGNP